MAYLPQEEDEDVDELGELGGQFGFLEAEHDISHYVYAEFHFVEFFDLNHLFYMSGF
jgi:hypothetical protein